MLIEKFLENLDIPTIVVLVIFGVSLITYLVVKISGMIIKKKLRPLAEMLNAEIKSSFMAGTYIRILNYGPEIHLRLTLGGKDNPSFLFLELLNPIGFNFRIMRKQALNQILFQWGKEVQLGDVSLDEEYIIRSDKPYEASSYLMDSRRIEAIKFFFENNFNEIKANARGIYINKSNYTDDDLSPERVGTYLDNLIGFSRM
jgi:hypothetical protein